MFFEMANERDSYFIGYSFIRTCCNSSFWRDIVILIPNREIILAGYYYNRRNCPIIRANSLNNGNSFSIALLKLFSFITFFGVYYYYAGGNFVYYKPSFIEVINIFIAYFIFRDNIRNKAKLITNDIWIFA
jgi:hypothetical protein